MRALLVLVLLYLPAVAAAAPDPAGRLIAQRECATCHAIGPGGASPLADAPRFSELRRRIDTWTLSRLIAERALVGHPRMPRLTLDPDEVAHLLAYWEALTPADRAALDASASPWHTASPRNPEFRR